MRAVQLQHVEAGLLRPPGGGGELGRHALHVLLGHRPRGLVPGRPGDRGGRHHRPAPLGERRVHFLPAEPRRPLRAGVPELAADLRARLPVHEVRDPLPGRGVLVRVEPRAAGGDPALGAHAGHLDGDEARSPLRPLGVVDQVPVPGEAPDRLVLGHRRDDDPVLEPEAAQGEGREHRRADRGVRRPGALLEPALGAAEPPGVAPAQVLVADPLRAGQQRVAELHGVEVDVPLHVLEPGEGVAGRGLEAERLHAPALLVAGERLLQGRQLDQGLGEGDRALHRELGAGADREVGGGGRVPEEHDVPVGPGLAEHAGEVEPRRAPEVGRVAQERMPAEVRGEDPPAGLGRLGLAHRPEAEPFPGRLRALHDEGRGARIELVGVRPDPAVGGLLEEEGEGVVELLPRAEPHELAAADVDVRAEVRAVRLAGARVQPVGGDHEVVPLGERGRVVGPRLEADLDPEARGPLLQQLEEPAAPDAAEAVAGGHDPLPPDADRDVVPVGEVAVDGGGAHRVVGGEVLQGFVGEDHPPPEGVAGGVALEHRDLVGRVAELQADREVEPRGAPAETGDVHGRRLPAP